MRRRRPALVVGFGGFVTGPGGVAAWLMRRPLMIHEQNAIAGYSNRVLARLARDVLAAFPQAFPAGVDARVVGNPVRAEIVMQPPPADAFRAPRRRAAPAGRGRKSGRVAAQHRGAVRHRTVGPRISTCATRRASAASTRRAAAYEEAGVTADVTPFINDMARGLRGCGPGDLPRRRAHHFRAGRGGRGRRSWCRFRPRWTITRPSMRSSWCAREPRC